MNMNIEVNYHGADRRYRELSEKYANMQMGGGRILTDAEDLERRQLELVFRNISGSGSQTDKARWFLEQAIEDGVIEGREPEEVLAHAQNCLVGTYDWSVDEEFTLHFRAPMSIQEEQDKRILDEMVQAMQVDGADDRNIEREIWDANIYLNDEVQDQYVRVRR